MKTLVILAALAFPQVKPDQARTPDQTRKATPTQSKPDQARNKPTQSKPDQARSKPDQSRGAKSRARVFRGEWRLLKFLRRNRV